MTALDEYVWRKDGAYGYEIVSNEYNVVTGLQTITGTVKEIVKIKIYGRGPYDMVHILLEPDVDVIRRVGKKSINSANNIYIWFEMDICALKFHRFLTKNFITFRYFKFLRFT